MDNYKNVPLIKLVDLANESCSELGAISETTIINYETGQRFEAPDEETALFIASAREIVLELARRIRELENPYSGLSALQWLILNAANGEFGTSVRTTEETEYRQACQLVAEGLLTKEYDPRAADGRVMFFHLTVKGREVLKFHPDKVASDK